MAYDSTTYTKPEVDEIGEIILKARELLSDPKRWCKGNYESNGAFCVVGAARLVSNSIYPGHVIKRIALALPTEHTSTTGRPEIFSFNDAPTTTHEDILALLDRAAAAKP